MTRIHGALSSCSYLEQDRDPKPSKQHGLEVSRAKTLMIWWGPFPALPLNYALSHLIFLSFLDTNFPAAVEISIIWWVSEAVVYSLELRRIIALTHRYSLCCSFSSRNLEVMARSISKISKIPSTHFPSSLWKHLKCYQKSRVKELWLSQIKAIVQRMLQEAYLSRLWEHSEGSIKKYEWKITMA